MRRPISSCSTGPKAAAPSRPRATFRCSGRSCSRTRSKTRRSRSTTMRRSGNGTASACSSFTSPAQTRIYSRTGDDISGSFPEIAEAFATDGVLDGELLVRGSDQGRADLHGGAAASFNALQQRLGRKNVSQKMLGTYPAFVRLYDILFDGPEDLRELRLDRSPEAAGAVRAAPRSRAVRPVAADRGPELRGAGGVTRRRPRRGDRGHDARRSATAPMSPVAAQVSGTSGSAIR